MSEEVMCYEPLKEPMAIGEVFAKSGLFPDVKSQAQAVVKILAGKELGLSPFQSMAGVLFIDGKQSIMATVMAGLIKKSKIYDYRVVSISDDECKIDFFNISNKENPEKLGTSIFGKLDAAKAGLINKPNYKNTPKNMYFARALSNGARWFTPDAIQGYVSIEEMRDHFDIETPEKTTVSISVPVAEAEVVSGKA